MKLTKMKKDRRTEKKVAEEAALMQILFILGLAKMEHTFGILIMDRTIPLINTYL